LLQFFSHKETYKVFKKLFHSFYLRRRCLCYPQWQTSWDPLCSEFFLSWYAIRRVYHNSELWFAMHLHFHWLRMRTRQKLRTGREFEKP